ncbi:hypothetical protein K7432_004957 [Basidiobolus ranarum]|uniref:C2H2-type domain-containing protein n=1 Tax=Basidiobolus ranarum TaxID=34480 RepID=A0ABR2WXG7_9FUNG
MSLSLKYNHSNYNSGMTYDTQYPPSSRAVQHISSHIPKHSRYSESLSGSVPFLNSSKSGVNFSKTEPMIFNPQNSISNYTLTSQPMSATTQVESPDASVAARCLSETSRFYSQNPRCREKHQSLSLDSYDFKEKYPSPLRSASLDTSYNLPRINLENPVLCSSPQNRDSSRSPSYTSSKISTPPPSLPPLSETLSNIFTESPKQSPPSPENCSVESVPSPTSVQYPSSHMSKARAVEPMATVLPSLASQYPPSQYYPQGMGSANPAAVVTSSSHHGLPSMFDASTNDNYEQFESSHSYSGSEEYEQDSKKMFSFVSLPGVNGKKRPRRKFDEIERLYSCNHQGCTKSYGTLNHLNAHVMMQKHGIKRLPSEFKELRKHWKNRRQSSSDN